MFANTTQKILDLKRVMKYDLLHSLSSGGGFGLVLFFVGLLVCFFISYHLLSPKSAGSQVTVLSARV